MPSSWGGVVDEPVDLGPRRPADLQAELEVLPHRHVGVQGVALEHHRDVAVLGGQIVHDPVADRDRRAGDLLGNRDHPQNRGLAAALRAHEHHELAFTDLEVEVPDDPGLVETLLYPSQRHARQSPSPLASSRQPKPRALRTGAARSVVSGSCRCSSLVRVLRRAGRPPGEGRRARLGRRGSSRPARMPKGRAATRVLPFSARVPVSGRVERCRGALSSPVVRFRSCLPAAWSRGRARSPQSPTVGRSR